jgi:hypothetical protein
MRGLKQWKEVGFMLAASLLLSGGALAESFDGLVPGEMLADEELDHYYGKGVTTTLGGVDTTNESLSPDLGGVDNQNEFLNGSISDDQGISNMVQIDGDYADVNVFVTIDVNVNGVEVGGPMILTDTSGGVISPMFDASGLVGPSVGGVDNVNGPAAPFIPSP